MVSFIGIFPFFLTFFPLSFLFCLFVLYLLIHIFLLQVGFIIFLLHGSSFLSPHRLAKLSGVSALPGSSWLEERPQLGPYCWKKRTKGDGAALVSLLFKLVSM